MFFKNREPQVPIPPTQQQPQHPWIASREEAMRLNALNLAVHTKDVVDPIEKAKEYYKFLTGEDQKDVADDERRWWQL